MIVTIHQPQYLPWLGYFEKIHRADIFVLLDNVQFKKNEWQNRNRIRTDQGWQWITVPVIHDFGQNINETKIDRRSAWGKKHIKALELNYSKAPYFDVYIQQLRPILERDWELLSDLNIHLVKQLMSWLGITTKVVISSEYEAIEHKTLRLVDLCNQLNAKSYLSGEGGGKYLDEDQFRKNNIDVMIQKYNHPVYTQLWAHKNDGEFISHLSVLDLLFNCGPQSLGVLMNKENNA